MKSIDFDTHRMKKIGERIKELRNEIGISQTELARRLDYSDSENVKGTISQWEKGKTLPTLPKLIKMSELFSVSVDYILCYSDCRHIENEDITDLTGLSDKSIEVLRKNYREGDNRFLFMLDLLLSEEDTFNILMDSLCNLVFPPSLVISKDLLGKREYIVLSLDDIEKLSETPDKIFTRIRSVLEEFAKNNRDKKIITPNEYHPLEYIDEHVYTEEEVSDFLDTKGGC